MGNKIFFDNATVFGAKALYDFVKLTEEKYAESELHAKNNKALKEALDSAIAENETLPDDKKKTLSAEYSALKAEDVRHKDTLKPINEGLAEVYKFVNIDKDFMALYEKGVAFGGNASDYKKALHDLLFKMGIRVDGECGKKALNAFANKIASTLTVRKATAKAYAKDGKLLAPYTKTQYKDMLLRAIVDYVHYEGYEIRIDSIVRK